MDRKVRSIVTFIFLALAPCSQSAETAPFIGLLASRISSLKSRFILRRLGFILAIFNVLLNFTPPTERVACQFPVGASA